VDHIIIMTSEVVVLCLNIGRNWYSKVLKVNHLIL